MGQKRDQGHADDQKGTELTPIPSFAFSKLLHHSSLFNAVSVVRVWTVSRVGRRNVSCCMLYTRLLWSGHLEGIGKTLNEKIALSFMCHLPAQFPGLSLSGPWTPWTRDCCHLLGLSLNPSPCLLPRRVCVQCPCLTTPNGSIQMSRK